MSTTEVDDREDQTAEAEKEKARLQLEVKIDKPSACERHVTVTVAKEDVARYVKEGFDDLVPKAELLRDVWGYRSIGATRTLDAHACRLRKKLGPSRRPWVLNVRGVGYKLTEGP